MATFTNILVTIDNVVWGVPLIVMIMGTGILMSLRLRFLQFRKLGIALRYMVSNEENGKGEVTSFQALCTAMAATVGTGNIVGVATAMVAGGPGALFWMIVAACFGMSVKFSEGVLAIKYRILGEDGHALGGPFYYIERGMGPRWKWMAKCFAVFGVLAGTLGIGTITQVNSIADAAQTFFDPDNSAIAFTVGENAYSWATVIAAVAVAALTTLVVIGGMQRIATVASLIVPAMIVIYVVVCLCILVANAEKIPAALEEVVAGAFGLRAAGGGMLGAMIVAMQKGIGRGLFSNEAGLGSAPIAAAAAQTNEATRQGLVSMTGTFIDTCIVCLMTGLTIMVTGSWNVGLDGVEVTIRAFGEGLPWSDSMGAFVLMVCLAFFAFTTILGWNYYSERCLEYLSHGNKAGMTAFRWIYILAVLIGPFLTISFVWTFASILNGLMALPNLIALVVLSGVIVKETKDYFVRLENGSYVDGIKRKK